MDAAVICSRAALTSLSTPHQRLYVRMLLAQLELDSRRFGIGHRRFWLGAGLPEPVIDSDIDSNLCALNRAQAGKLINSLRAEVSDEQAR